LLAIASHDVARLVDGNGAIGANLEVQEPSEFTHIRDIEELADVRVESPDSVSSDDDGDLSAPNE
jgi:hypothetical protein